MAFASLLALKVGEEGSRGTPGTSPGYAPESDDFVEKSTIWWKKRDEIDVRTYPQRGSSFTVVSQL